MVMLDYNALRRGAMTLSDGGQPTQGWRMDLSALGALVGTRLEHVAHFWREDENALRCLGDSLTRLLTGFFQANAPWGWLVQSAAGRISIYALVSGDVTAASVWARTVVGCLPGAIFGDVALPGFASGITSTHACCEAFIAASPHALNGIAEPAALDLALLARAMVGGDWAMVVLAQPVTTHAVEDQLRNLQMLAQETRYAFLRHHTAEERNHRLAEHYVEMLDAEHERLDSARHAGLWSVGACLLGPPALLAAGAPLIVGHLSCAKLPQATWRAVSCASSHGQPAISWLTSAEAASLLAVPTEEVAGIAVRPRHVFAQHGASTTVRATAVGKLAESAEWFEIPVSDWTRHGLICGTPGSGKTRTAQFLLRQLWEEHGVPFLVLDPAKSDYRQLLGSPLGADLRVFTPGLPGGPEFPFNPLSVPDGVPVQAHVDGVKALILASFGWVTPMPEVLGLAIEAVYLAKGWNFITGTHPRRDRDSHPTLDDLLRIVPEVVDTCGYDGEIRATIRAGITTRLRSLIGGSRRAVLSAPVSIPLPWLLEKPAVIELGWFGDAEQRAFLLGALLLALANHRRAQGPAASLRHVLLIEEAHRLLSAPPPAAGHEHAQSRQRAVEEFCNLLAEIRSYGQGVLVVEQMPTKLAPDVLANTGFKICHHLVSDQDREKIGATMNLQRGHQEFLARLRPGEALAVRAGQDQPFLVRVPDHAERLGFATFAISAREMQQRMHLHPPPFSP